MAGGVLTESTVQNTDGRAVEEIYQKKTQLEHILLRPDTYVGSTEHQQQLLWVHDGEKMLQRNVNIVPGLYKIFDEILVNAADNKIRDPTMNRVNVDVDETTGRITVWNNGNGVPVELHKKEGVYVPELIFGHLLTSSNYDDTQKKVTGGRNGYGAKLANIFSTEFIIETCDGTRQKRYRQVFNDNMAKKSQPRITACKASDNWTSVEFKPDYAKFGMENLEEDILALMRKRVYDLAGVLGQSVKVFYNGQRLPVKTFQDYINLYLGPKEGGVARVYEKIGDRWEVCISPTDGQFQQAKKAIRRGSELPIHPRSCVRSAHEQLRSDVHPLGCDCKTATVCHNCAPAHSKKDGRLQVSFVNSICTSKGGTHVKLILDQICKTLTEKINKKNKNASVKDFMVKNHIWVFVNCLIENPAFDSQTKETLTLKASSFGSKCDLPSAFIDKVGKSGVLDSIMAFATFKQNRELKKTDGTKRSRLLGIPKLDDANDAGGRHSDKCTLILTEGDSAKALAISGLSVVGRDAYGVFPLRGKLLNVRDASAAQGIGAMQVGANAEITALKQIIGLQHGKNYTDTKGLRYGHIMIMTDQDQDGSHIKGLIMNFLHHFFPSLLHVPGFLLEFITPIVKATKKTQTKVFYTMPEYEKWKESLNNELRGWTIKYYKGLGTSTSKEAKDYFSQLGMHKKTFIWRGESDGAMLELAFSKKKIEERKSWLRAFVPGTYLDHSASQISYEDFVNRELILFSRADLERSIPSMLDGLKPGQRKILFACFKRNLKADVKVAQLAGYIAEHSAYHHGEASLQSTIVGLAQDFVGSNNICMLFPSGQFGTRLQGGKDSASPRYIFTRLAPLTRHLFNESDDVLLRYNTEEGDSIEPEWYLPILPTVLINGAEGIGTGWSTSIPNFNPKDIIENLRRLLAGQELVDMKPWYRGFKGDVVEIAAARNSTGRSYQVSGIINEMENGDLEITELPIRKWTQDYKEFLDAMVKPENKNATPALLDYREHHTDTTVHFTVTMSEAGRAEATAKGLPAFFKLQTKISTSNMMLFDAQGTIKKYNSPEHILQDFFSIRLDYYERRRLQLLACAQSELLRISNKVRFILSVIRGELVISNRKKRDIESDMEHMGFDKLPKTSAASKRAAVQQDDTVEQEDDEVTNAIGRSYDYLLSMPISSLTFEKVQSLEHEEKEQNERVAVLQVTTKEDMWATDLDAFEAAYDEWLEDEANEAADLAAARLRASKNQSKKGAKGKAPAKKAAAKKKPLDSEDEISDASTIGDDDDEDDFDPKPAPRPAPNKAAARTKAGAAAASASAAAGPSRGHGAAAASSQSDSLANRLGEMGISHGPSKQDECVDIVSDPDDYDVTSPAPVLKKSQAPATGKSLPKSAPQKAPTTKKTAAKAKAPLAPKAAAAVKRKPATKKPAARVDSGDDDDEVASSSRAIAELDPPTPSVAPTGKVRRMRPSPFHKASGVSASAAASEDDSEDDEPVNIAPAPRARPARRAAAPSKYTVDLLSSDENDLESDGGREDDDDEFELDSD